MFFIPYRKLIESKSCERTDLWVSKGKCSTRLPLLPVIICVWLAPKRPSSIQMIPIHNNTTTPESNERAIRQNPISGCAFRGEYWVKEPNAYRYARFKSVFKLNFIYMYICFHSSFFFSFYIACLIHSLFHYMYLSSTELNWSDLNGK